MFLNLKLHLTGRLSLHKFIPFGINSNKSPGHIYFPIAFQTGICLLSLQVDVSRIRQKGKEIRANAFRKLTSGSSKNRIGMSDQHSNNHHTHDMQVYKPKQFHPQQRQQDHHHHKLARVGYNLYNNIPPASARILRGSGQVRAYSEVEFRSGHTPPPPYGQTMDIHHNQKNQQSQCGTNSRSARSANAATLLDLENGDMYQQVEPDNSLCSKCHGIILAPEKLPDTPLPPLTTTEGSWYYNYQIHQPMLQRNNSIGGFTLTGQDTRKVKKSWMSRFCSSHKIALVVSAFSFLVTIGLTVTLILMKNKGMMEPM